MWVPQAMLISMAIGFLANGGGVEAVIWPAICVLAFGLVRSAAEAVGLRLAYRSARSMLSCQRSIAADVLASRSPLDKGRTEAGRAASIMSEQAEALVPYLARYHIARVRAVIIPVILVFCVFALSWVAAIVLLLAAPLIPIFMALIGWRAKAASEAQLVELGNMNAFLLDRLRGLTTIRNLDAVDATARRVRADAEQLRAKTMGVLRIAFLSSAVLEFFAALGVAMVAVYVGFHLLGQIGFGAWGGTLTLAEGLFILLLAPACFEPLRELSSVWHDRAAGLAAQDALDGLKDVGSPMLGGSAVASPQVYAAKQPPAVDIRHLDFQYCGAGRPIFSNLNLSIRPGEHVALLGPSGSGKSTLLALVAGLVASRAGEIRIGDRRLDTKSAAALRTRMAWIGQRPHIFPGTIIDNIRLGRADVGSNEIADALAFAHLDRALRECDSGSIGENGVGLSGGEALRLALARIAVTPSADLILADEPTAHLDIDTAQEITTGLLRLAVGRTLVLATHDPALASRMDRIVRLEPQSLSEAA
jgi:ATP-binding cassette subfamily C protein CydD